MGLVDLKKNKEKHEISNDLLLVHWNVAKIFLRVQNVCISSTRIDFQIDIVAFQLWIIKPVIGNVLLPCFLFKLFFLFLVWVAFPQSFKREKILFNFRLTEMPKLFTVLLGNFLQNMTTLKTMIDLIYKIVPKFCQYYTKL